MKRILIFALSAVLLVACGKPQDSGLSKSLLSTTGEGGAGTSNLPQTHTCDLSHSLIKKIDFSKENNPFTQVGTVGEFNFTTSIGHDYPILYYIPNSIGKTDLTNQKVLIFLHGGGSTTANSPSGARSAINSYMGFLKTYAENNKYVVLGPMSIINWNWNADFVVRDFAKFMKNVANVDPNEIVVSGHSMGGMGTSRSTWRWIDQIAGAVPSASGLPESNRIDGRYLSYFNTVFRRQQGTADHFKDFVTDSRAEAARVRELASVVGYEADYLLKEHSGNHNPNQGQLETLINEVFAKPRNLYQKKIYANFLQDDRKLTIEGNANLHRHILPEYLWLEALDFSSNPETDQNHYINAEIVGNEIKLNDHFEGNDIKTIRIYLSSKLLDLNKGIKISYKGNELFNGKISVNPKTRSDIKEYKQDQKFDFEECIDLDL